MIQIKRNNLDELAEEHYLGIQKNVEKKLLEHKVVADLLIKQFTLKEIITGNPTELEKIIAAIPEDKVILYKKEFTKIFNYEGFKTWENYGAYHLAKKLQVNVCPYCNRQYTFTIIEKGEEKGKTRPEFDHFYSQADYPFLALSFYNLIPSCKICNSTLKGSGKWSLSTHIHPYQDGFGDKCKFSLKLLRGKGVDFFYGEQDAFEVILKHKGDKRIEKNIKDLCLEPIYNEHKDYIQDLIQTSILYSESYVNSLYHQFEGTLFSSVGDIQKLVLGNYISEEDLEKRVLSKLTKDISEELNII